MTITNTYNEFDQPVTTTDPDGHTTTNTYDLNSHYLTQVTYADGSIVEYKRDAFGNVIVFTNALGNTTQYTYDLLNRPTLVTYPNFNTERYTYDAVGHVKAYQAGTLSIGYLYNNIDKLQSINSNGIQAQYTYDSLQRRASLQDDDRHHHLHLLQELVATHCHLPGPRQGQCELPPTPGKPTIFLQGGEVFEDPTLLWELDSGTHPLHVRLGPGDSKVFPTAALLRQIDPEGNEDNIQFSPGDRIRVDFDVEQGSPQYITPGEQPEVVPFTWEKSNTYVLKEKTEYGRKVRYWEPEQRAS